MIVQLCEQPKNTELYSWKGKIYGMIIISQLKYKIE